MSLRIPLHVQIVLALVLGLIYGVLAIHFDWVDFTQNWINPWGDLFMRLLKLIAVPLILASLVTGISSLSDVRKLSRIGGKTIGLYICTTAIALTLGVVVANVIKPGLSVPAELRDQLQSTYQGELGKTTMMAEQEKEKSTLQPIVEMVPENIMSATGDNRMMLQVVFFALLFGVALIRIPTQSAEPVVKFFSGVNDAVIGMVDLIMLMAPLGVFALLAKTVTAFADQGVAQVLELISALGLYCFSVCLGLFLHSFLVLPGLLMLLTPLSYYNFFKGIREVQLLAFSTSSSGATLPLTMEKCQQNLGVSEEVASFALPLGATINMDGTALYQAVAAIFIGQTMGIELDLYQQLTIILTGLLASIGTASVPGAGLIMLVIILESVGIPSSGIALILGVDRILDMLRTVTNVTGDAVVSSVVAASEGQLHVPSQGQS